MIARRSWMQAEADKIKEKLRKQGRVSNRSNEIDADLAEQIRLAEQQAKEVLARCNVSDFHRPAKTDK